MISSDAGVITKLVEQHIAQPPTEDHAEYP